MTHTFKTSDRTFNKSKFLVLKVEIRHLKRRKHFLSQNIDIFKVKILYLKSKF